MYCPLIPIQNNWIPAINTITQISDAQPATGSPKHTLRTTITARKSSETTVIIMPNSEDKYSGVWEKLIIPSSAYLHRFQKFHFVSPATRPTFSNGIQYVRNPTHPKIPFEKRLYSPI